MLINLNIFMRRFINFIFQRIIKSHNRYSNFTEISLIFSFIPAYLSQYSSHDEMVLDLQLMFNNACNYNEEGSSVYNDAKLLDSIVKKRLRTFVSYNGNVNRPITSRSSLTTEPWVSLLFLQLIWIKILLEVFFSINL